MSIGGFVDFKRYGLTGLLQMSRRFSSDGAPIITASAEKIVLDRTADTLEPILGTMHLDLQLLNPRLKFGRSILGSP
jgi:hypothetical protein